MGGSKMKMHVRIGFKPAVVLWFMGVKIIQHHMEFFTGIVGDKLVHEVQKLAPAPAPVMARMHYELPGDLAPGSSLWFTW
jgi:hypothetical protein